MCLTSLAFQPNSADYVRRRREYINELLQMVDGFIFPSEYPKSALLSLYGNVAESKCEVIEHGINKMLMQGYEQYIGNKPHLNLAFLGAFRKAKGSDSFLSLIEYLKHKRDIKFFIFGRIEDTISTAHENLCLLGEYNRNHLPSLLREHQIDVILLLSPWPETYSYTLTEAIISGVPVISTDLGALRERVSKHFAGWLVPCENPLQKIITIIDGIIHNKEVLAFFKKKLYKSSEMIPTLEEMSKKYVEFYDKLYVENTAGFPLEG